MPLKLQDFVPENLAAEKEKFFTRQTHYDPQFTYKQVVTKQDLYRYGKPSWSYLYLAKRILQDSKKQGILIYDDSAPSLTEEELRALITDYLNRYQLASQFQLSFSPVHISRMAINFAPPTIKIRLPIMLSRREIIPTLNHEIGTHILRQINYQQQPWYKKKKKYGLHNHLKTEEGLANLHSLLTEPFELAAKAALNYTATAYALRHSFQQTFQFINSYLQNPERSFIWTFKKKRGLTDTSRPGTFSKDMLYFSGFIDVLRYLRKNHYDPALLYFGKVALEDLPQVKRLNPDYRPLLPHFFTDSPELYKARVAEIAKANLRFPF